MVDISDLLKKQDKKIKAKQATLQGRVRIERAGAVRPWQEGLPQYQEETLGFDRQPQKSEPSVAKTSQRTTGDSSGRQPANNRGQTSLKQGVTGDNNGGHIPPQQGTTGDNNGGQRTDNGGHPPPQQGTTGDNNGGRRTDNGGHAPPQQGTTGDSPPKKTGLSPVTRVLQPTPAKLVPPIKLLCPPTQPGTGQETNGGQFPKAPQEIALLLCLAKEVINTGLGTTRVLKNDELADLAKIKRTSFKKVRNRLLASGHCGREVVGQGRGARVGCVYSVSDAALMFLKANGGQVLRATGDKPEEKADSSSRFFNKGTTTKAAAQLALANRFQEFLERIEVDPKFEIDENDLVGWWAKVEMGLGLTLEDFEQQVERWAFKLKSSPMGPNTTPKAIFASRILKQVCGVPPGFVSWSERQARVLEEARNSRHQEMQRLQLAQYESDFETWFMKATDEAVLKSIPEQAKHLRPEHGQALNRNSPALKAIVKTSYADSNGIDYLHWEHLFEQVNMQ